MILDGTEIEAELIDDQKIIDYLTKLGYIGVLYPVSSKDSGPKIVGLLVDVSHCLDQVEYRFKLKLTRAEFTQICKKHDVEAFKGIDDFVKAKQKRNLSVQNTHELGDIEERFNSLL